MRTDYQIAISSRLFRPVEIQLLELVLVTNVQYMGLAFQSCEIRQLAKKVLTCLRL